MIRLDCFLPFVGFVNHRYPGNSRDTSTGRPFQPLSLTDHAKKNPNRVGDGFMGRYQTCPVPLGNVVRSGQLSRRYVSTQVRL